MFYDKFAQLCMKNGISVSRAATEAGISKSLVSKWKSHQTAVPSSDVLSKISRYFNIPISDLLNETPTPEMTSGHPSINRADLKFALFNGRETVTDAMLEEVLSFAEYVAHREELKQK